MALSRHLVETGQGSGKPDEHFSMQALGGRLCDTVANRNGGSYSYSGIAIVTAVLRWRDLFECAFAYFFDTPWHNCGLRSFHLLYLPVRVHLTFLTHYISLSLSLSSFAVWNCRLHLIQ